MLGLAFRPRCALSLPCHHRAIERTASPSTASRVSNNGTNGIIYNSRSTSARRPRADATPASDPGRHSFQIAAGAHRREHGQWTGGSYKVFTYTPAALKPTAELIQNFEVLVQGESLAPIEIEQKLAKRFRCSAPRVSWVSYFPRLRWRCGTPLARSHGTSLVRLLGGIKKPIPSSGAVGYCGVEGSAKVAEDWVKRGFSGLKAKIGYPTVQEDVAVVRACVKQSVIPSRSWSTTIKA
jgi:hypothetical protein